MNLNYGGLFHYIEVQGLGETWNTVIFIAMLIGMIAIAYLLGSINSAIIISKTIYRDDIRKHGSGNPGLTNMLRTYGMKAAGLTLLGDLLKTALAVFIAGVFFGFFYFAGISGGDGMCYVAGMFAVIGHIAPVYYKFKGGKGVLSTAVVVLILAPIPFLILITMFVIIVAISKYVSLGSVVAAISYPIVLHGYFQVAKVFGEIGTPALASLSAILIAILIVYCHRENLKRISEKTERKISFKKKPKTDEAENEVES